ncbi:MAG: hypothetical protein SFY68_07440, partial [Candidatus Sumerlaeia bacterium]|nr:hypothetical protein [Candidatus Sumerlaeia bacterium]
MKNLFAPLAALAVVALASSAQAQFPATQTFSGFTIGDVAGQGSWTQSAAASPNAQVVAGDLNISGFTALSDDRALEIVGGGQDVGISFGSTVPATDGTALYASFLMSVSSPAAEADVPDTNPAASNTDDDYFFHFTEGTAAGGTNFRSRVFIDNNANGFYLGIRNSSGDPGTYFTTLQPLNTPTLVVVKLAFGASIDESSIFVNRVQATEPVTADAVATDALATAAIGRIGIRADSALETPRIKFDQIRVGTSWADVVPFVAPTAPEADVTFAAAPVVDGTATAVSLGTFTQGT